MTAVMVAGARVMDKLPFSCLLVYVYTQRDGQAELALVAE